MQAPQQPGFRSPVSTADKIEAKLKPWYFIIFGLFILVLSAVAPFIVAAELSGPLSQTVFFILSVLGNPIGLLLGYIAYGLGSYRYVQSSGHKVVSAFLLLLLLVVVYLSPIVLNNIFEYPT